MLSRAVGVRAARDRCVHPVRADVGGDEKVAGGLGRRVRAGRMQRVGLPGAVAPCQIAVHLVRRDLDEPCAGLAGPLEHRLHTQDVRLHELPRAEDRAVDVRLCSEVDRRLAAGAPACDRVGVGDVTDRELARRRRRDWPDCPAYVSLSRTTTSLARRDQPAHEMRADEAGAAGDENLHRGEAYRPPPAAAGYASREAATGTPEARRASAEAAGLRTARCAGPSTRAAAPGARAPRVEIAPDARSRFQPRRRSPRRTRPRCSRRPRRGARRPRGRLAVHELAHRRGQVPDVGRASALVVDDRDLVALQAEPEHRADEVVTGRAEEPRAPHDPRVARRPRPPRAASSGRRRIAGSGRPTPDTASSCRPSKT